MKKQEPKQQADQSALDLLKQFHEDAPKVQKFQSQGSCPNCGYCPCCGRHRNNWSYPVVYC